MDLGDQIESIVLNLPYCLRISILVLHSDKSSCLRHTWELLKVPQVTGMMPNFSTKTFIPGSVGGREWGEVINVEHSLYRSHVCS